VDKTVSPPLDLHHFRLRVSRRVGRGTRAAAHALGRTEVAAPNPPRGWTPAPPDFVGVGAQKAGTSWWAALIAEHPDVHRAPGVPKELHYFDRFWDQPFRDEHRAEYTRFFPRPAGGFAGEWTPAYMVDFWTPELIAMAAPEARILVLLRDPLERFRSGLAHADQSAPREPGPRDAAGAFQRGLYAQQLRRLYETFPRSQVLVLQYEACRRDPDGELARTFRFIGLRPAVIPEAAIRREVNPTTARKAELSPSVRAALLAGYAADLAGLPSLAPGLDLSLWPSARAG
jgi:Sulfotransferase domain